VVLLRAILRTSGRCGKNPFLYSFLNILVANERWGELELCFFRASGQLVLSFSKKIKIEEGPFSRRPVTRNIIGGLKRLC
jgi:hypothetical protein